MAKDIGDIFIAHNTVEKLWENPRNVITMIQIINLTVKKYSSCLSSYISPLNKTDNTIIGHIFLLLLYINSIGYISL